jgi:DNA-binding LytR/AlgR family response regulator
MTAIIIEDEHIIANVLKNKIRKVDDDIEILDILDSKQSAIDWLETNRHPDVIFMDIQLSDGVSFEIFEQVEITSPVIFTTAYDEYAVKAFKVNGVDYLLKPIQDDELADAIGKVKAKKNPTPDTNGTLNEAIRLLLHQNQIALPFKEIFLADHKNQKIPVKVNEIAVFCKEIVNCIYNFAGEKLYLDYTTLDEIESLLDPKIFFRVNRQYIINFEAVQSIKSMNNSKIEVVLKKPNHNLLLDVSRQRCPDFRKWLNR